MLISISYAISLPGYRFTHTGGGVGCGPSQFVRDVYVVGTNLPSLTSLSAASYQPKLASGMITAAFGDNLASTTEISSSPDQKTVGGRRVLVRDSAGVEKEANLLYVSPTQINYVLPAGLADGPGVIKLGCGSFRATRVTL